jgi:hypothetical protein
MKKVYECNICRDPMPATELIGVVFKTNKAFELGSPHHTDGVHICFRCAGQLRAQLPSMTLSGVDKHG